MARRVSIYPIRMFRRETSDEKTMIFPRSSEGLTRTRMAPAWEDGARRPGRAGRPARPPSPPLVGELDRRVVVVSAVDIILGVDSVSFHDGEKGELANR